MPDGRIGVVGKAHHCLVDGLAAVELMALLLDATPEPEAQAGESWTARAVPGSVAMVGDAFANQAAKALALARVPLR